MQVLCNNKINYIKYVQDFYEHIETNQLRINLQYQAYMV